MNLREKRLRLIITTSALILWLTTNLYYFWIKVAGAIFLVTGLIQLTCFLTAIIATVFLTISMIRHSEDRGLKNYLTIGFFFLLLIASNMRSLTANENTFQSPVKMRACYEGTMNTSYLYFRENGTFEDFNIGWFASVHYHRGSWTQQEDTLRLDFEREKPRLLDEKIIIKDGNLYTLQADTLVPTYYYLGYCKRLN